MKNENTIEGIVAVVEGREPGPRAVVFAAVHGDEPCGVIAFERIIPSLELARGSATFVIANPRALAEKRRFTEANLNRLFRSDAELDDAKRASYEYARSRELMPLLEKADALLDIHSSESPKADPFIVCGEASRKIAERMPFPIISWGWDTPQVEPGGTDDFMERMGKIGICIECGFDTAASTADKAEESVRRFLALMGLTDESVPERDGTQKALRAVYAHIAKENFVPSALVPDFEPVEKGTLIGTDGTTEMRAPKDGYLIFVRAREGAGQEAYVFAEDA